MKYESPRNSIAPYSPRLITSVCGPISRILLAALRRLFSPESMRASLIVDQQKVPSRMVSSSSSRKSLIQKFMVSPPARRRLLHLRADAALQRGLDVAEQQIRRAF